MFRLCTPDPALSLCVCSAPPHLTYLPPPPPHTHTHLLPPPLCAPGTSPLVVRHLLQPLRESLSTLSESSQVYLMTAAVQAALLVLEEQWQAAAAAVAGAAASKQSRGGPAAPSSKQVGGGADDMRERLDCRGLAHRPTVGLCCWLVLLACAAGLCWRVMRWPALYLAFLSPHTPTPHLLAPPGPWSRQAGHEAGRQAGR